MRLSIQIEFDKILDLETHKSSVIVGRADTNDLVIAHDSISRMHCLIECAKGAFYVTDLGSSNGTFIDGVRLEPRIKNHYLPSQQLTLSKLDCEISNQHSGPVEGPKIISSTVSTSGDFTATLRFSRLDLSRPVTPKKIKPSGPLNHVSEGRSRAPKNSSKRFKDLLLFIFIILALTAAWILAPN